MFRASTTTEAEVLLASRGDREAFGRLVAATRSLVASIALVELRDVEAARDVAQDVYLQVWDDLHELRTPASFLPFLRQVTRLRARRVAERRAREVSGPVAEELLAGAIDPALDPGSRLLRAEQEAVVRKALDSLPEDARETVALYYLEGHSAARVARLLGLSEQAVFQRLSRARALLRADVLARLGDALVDVAPGAGFTAAVIASLPSGASAMAGITGLAAASVGAGKITALGAGIAVLAAILAVTVASGGGGGRVPVESVASPSGIRSPGDERAPAAGDDHLRRRIAELEEQVRLQAAVPVRAAAPQENPPELSPPVPFPSVTPPANTPAEFRPVVEALLAKCAPGVKVQEVECSEFPCIAWTSVDTALTPKLDLLGCEEWKATFGEKLMVYGRRSEDGSSQFAGLFSLPDDPEAIKNIQKRARLRLDALGQSYGIQPPKGPLAAACPDCPDGAVFIGCTQGDATMMLAFPPGMKTGFTMKGWKSMLQVTATRTSEALLRLELQSPGPGGVGKEKAVTLRIGETVTVVPGKDVDVAAVGGNAAPVRCAWLE